MIESVRFEYANNKIIVTLFDGSEKEYTRDQKDAYLQEFPSRSSDVVAMGW